MSSNKGPARVVVLGAGATGLTAAYELLKRADRDRHPLDVTVLEASARPGGKIFTETRDGSVIEAGPDSFITSKPQALELVRELGLGGELVGTSRSAKTKYSPMRCRVIPVPSLPKP